MIFRKKVGINKHAKKVDKLVTGVIIGGAIASMIGLSRTNKGKTITKNITDSGVGVAKTGVSVFGKVLLGIMKLFTKKK